MRKSFSSLCGVVGTLIIALGILSSVFGQGNPTGVHGDLGLTTSNNNHYGVVTVRPQTNGGRLGDVWTLTPTGGTFKTAPTNGFATTGYVDGATGALYITILGTVWSASQYPQALLTNGSRQMRAPLNMGGNVISNMAAGVNPLDAVNVGQLTVYLTTNGNGSALTGVLHASDTNNLPNRTEMNTAIGGATNGMLPASSMSGFVTEGPTGVTTGDLAGPSINRLRLEKLNTNAAILGQLMWFNGTFWTNASIAAIPPIVIETNANSGIRASIATNGNASQFLNGAGVFSTPSGSGGGGDIWSMSNNTFAAGNTNNIPIIFNDRLSSSNGTLLALHTSSGTLLQAQIVPVSGTLSYRDITTCIWNCATIQYASLLQSNATVLIMSNYVNGGNYTLELTQTAVGKTLSMSPSNNFFTANGITGAGFIPTTNAAGARDFIDFRVMSTGNVAFTIFRNLR